MNQVNLASHKQGVLFSSKLCSKQHKRNNLNGLTRTNPIEPTFRLDRSGSFACARLFKLVRSFGFVCLSWFVRVGSSELVGSTRFVRVASINLVRLHSFFQVNLFGLGRSGWFV